MTFKAYVAPGEFIAFICGESDKFSIMLYSIDNYTIEITIDLEQYNFADQTLHNQGCPIKVWKKDLK